ncbi:MAG TPA: hypothetical protein VE758_04270 [Chthoniobacterales bacterium]|nr:hypothetical protein [Chthoniobacterales bacterium]
MIADSYLQLRNELEAAVTGLLKLAGEMQRTAPWLDMLQSFVTEIRQPLLLVFIGESKSGESSLLNALFGTDFLANPDSRHICVFQYGRESNSAEPTPMLREIYLPATFLRDLKIVAAPGLEKLTPQTRQTVLEFLSRADLVLLVFSVRKAWLPANWEFLAANQVPLTKFVFVLQPDAREPKEIAIIRRNLEDGAKQKLGFAPPIFAISAPDALAARSNRSREQQTEFEALKEQINLVVTESGGRVQQLLSACQLAQLMLHDIASELRVRVDAVEHDERRLARAEALRQTLQQQTLHQINDALDQLERTCRERARGTVEAIKRKLWPANIATLLGRSGVSLQDWEADCARKLRACVEQQVNKAAEVLETELRGIWPRVHDSIDQQLVTGAKEKVPELGPDVAEQKRELLDAMSRVLSQHLVANAAAPVALMRKVSAALAAVLIIAGLSIAAVAVTLKVNSRVPIVILLAICAASVACLVAWRGRKLILRAYAQAKDVQLRELRDAVSGQFERTIDRFQNAVFEKLQPLIQDCAAERSRSEPVLRRAEELQRTLGGLSSRLR